MSWKKVLVLGLLVAALGIDKATAQINILNAKKPEDIGTPSKEDSLSPGKPIPYGFVSDRDILWKKEVWEFIDLDERVNFPLYFPTEELSQRRSLFMVLKDALQENKIDVYRDSYFTEKVESFQDIEYVLSRMDSLQPATANFMNANPGQPLPPGYVNKIDILPEDIQGYKIRGVWYFDKRQGELKYRIVGIAPCSKSVYDLKNDEATFIELFWVWYPSAREILYEAKAFNERNSATPISFDHLLNSRRFNAVIYQVENVYGDRTIKQYIPQNALFQLLEADRIKEQIRDREQDMWTY